ncbi:hypothetical protein PENTCL1PPCAC_1180, partial [Pristionchus entomophagus]
SNEPSAIMIIRAPPSVRNLRSASISSLLNFARGAGTMKRRQLMKVPSEISSVFASTVHSLLNFFTSPLNPLSTLNCSFLLSS